jgi:hypothetical protein
MSGYIIKITNIRQTLQSTIKNGLSIGKTSFPDIYQWTNCKEAEGSESFERKIKNNIVNRQTEKI